jgi:predicted unusual protein kinase regulating ubiquinone biosynthesis (AarF/ABC1/UbiB family)
MIFKTRHLPRYKDIARLFWRYGRSDLFRQFAEVTELRSEAREESKDEPNPEALARDLEKMGPTFIKLGQLLSTRADLLPPPYLQALTRLQDSIEPFSFAQVEAIVQAELGARLSKAFSEFESEPVAAASLGQVHRARLRDGREVAVKIQRPDIRKSIAEDLEVLEEIATFLDEHTDLGRRHRFVQILEQFRRTLVHELDYQREASNLTLVGENLREFKHLRVSKPVADYTTRSVLTMEYVHGQKITELSPMARLDLEGGMLADELFKAYLKQVLVDGLFHADPHPGNMCLTEDRRIALLDLGMVGRVSPGCRSICSSCSGGWRRQERRRRRSRHPDKRSERRI